MDGIDPLTGIPPDFSPVPGDVSALHRPKGAVKIYRGNSTFLWGWPWAKEMAGGLVAINVIFPYMKGC